MVMLRWHIATEMTRQKSARGCDACYDGCWVFAGDQQSEGAFMDRRIPYFTVGSMLRAATTAVMILAAVPATGAFAQTLTDPNPPAKWSPPHAAAKSPAAAATAATAKPCSGFGAGFVQVPGTGACIKIGGWVSVEGSASR
jgi:hypothetical protein